MQIFSVLLFLIIAAGVGYFFMQQRKATQAEEMAGETAAAIARGQTVPSARRVEQLCPSCATMNTADSRVCRECGAAMSAGKLGELWEGSDKQEVIREGIQAGLLIAGMGLAMAVSSWLPVGGKIAVLLATVGILTYRFWGRIMGG